MPYTSQQDLPTLVREADPTHGVPAIYSYRGQNVYEENLPPQVLADFRTANGTRGPIPAGQPGSPYPATLPATGFDAAVEDVKRAAAEGNAANLRRYNQGLANTQRQLNLIDSTFAGVRSRTAANNLATDQELGRVQDTLRSGYTAALEDVNTVGQRATEEVNRREASANATSDASLRSRGLGNTTVIDSGRRRNAEVGNRGRADIAEGVAQLRSGIRERGTQALTNFGVQRAGVNQAGRTQENTDARDYLSAFYQGLSDRRGFIERRTDETPSAYDIATLIGNHEVGQATARAQRDAGDKQLLGGLLGAGGTILGSILSDRRAKKNIRKVGTGPDGNTVYRWKYTDALVESGKAPAGEFVGPMAQDVQKTSPDRVAQGADGYLRILS